MKKLIDLYPEAGASKVRLTGLSSPIVDNTATLEIEEVVGDEVVSKRRVRCWTCDKLEFDDNNFIVSDHFVDRKAGKYLVLPGATVDTTGLGVIE